MTHRSAPAALIRGGPSLSGHHRRTAWLAAAGLVAAGVLAATASWHSPAVLHTMMEAFATMLAAVIATLALSRYRSRPSNLYLFLFAGFLGTAALDAYHAIVTSEPAALALPGADTLLPWSWLAGRFMLSGLLLMATVAWFPSRPDGPARAGAGADTGADVSVQPSAFGAVPTNVLLAGVALFTLVCFGAFLLLPLPDPTTDGLIGRPLELIPGLLFLAALIVHARTGAATATAFGHTVALGLMASTGTQAVMALSGTVHDSYFDVAHALKVASYGLFFLGMVAELNGIYKRAQQARLALGHLNASLTNEIEERRELTAALEHREALLQEAQALAHLGNWEWDVLADRVTWSDELFRIYGHPPGAFEVNLQRFLDQVHPDDQERVETEVRRAMATQRPTMFHHRVIRPDGKVRTLQARVNVEAEGGQVTRLWGTGQDVTEREQADRELRAFASRLQSSNRELEEFAYVASHDLQEPLRKIVAFGSRLETELADTLPDRSQDQLNRMLTAATRMQDLINDLLDLSRVTTRGQPFMRVDLNAVVSDAMKALELRLEQTGGRIHVGDLPEVEGDASQLRQLFQNLIANALKFHRPGTTPVVAIRVEAAGNEGEGVDQSDAVVIEVSDNGIGFDPSYAHKLFLPFQRLHGRSEFEGTGMGLAICRRIVERHAGTIRAESAADEGATFLVTLPRRQVPVTDADQRPDPSPPPVVIAGAGSDSPERWRPGFGPAED